MSYPTPNTQNPKPFLRPQDGWRGGVGTLGRVALQLFEEPFDCGFERRVFAAGEGLGAVYDFDVGVNARAFDLPLARDVEEAEGGRREAAAVGELRVAGETDQAAPRRRAEDAAEAALAEVEG